MSIELLQRKKIIEKQLSRMNKIREPLAKELIEINAQLRIEKTSMQDPGRPRTDWHLLATAKYYHENHGCSGKVLAAMFGIGVRQAYGLIKGENPANLEYERLFGQKIDNNLKHFSEWREKELHPNGR